MSRNAAQLRKHRIRSRDRLLYPKLGSCVICGKIGTTELHHLRYSDRFSERHILELCHACHLTMHGKPNLYQSKGSAATLERTLEELKPTQ